MDAHTQAFCQEFGRRCERRRRLLRLRQWEVGQAIGWHRAHVSGLEHGGYQSVRLDQLAKLADVLQTSADYLLQRVADDPGTIPPLPCPAEGHSLDGTTPLPVAHLPEETDHGECISFPYRAPD